MIDSVHFEELALGIFLQHDRTALVDPLQLVAPVHFGEFKKLIIQLDLIIGEEVVNFPATRNGVLDNIVGLGVVDLHLPGNARLPLNRLEDLFDVAVDVVDDDKPPGEDLLDELLAGLDFLLTVVVDSLDLYS